MRKATLCALVVLLCAGLCAMIHAAGGSEKVEGVIRPPAVAAQFYPDSPDALRLAVQKFLADGAPRRVAKPIALIVPHAGYVFSGQIAADAFKQAEGGDYEVVVILGTNHTIAHFHRVSVFTGQGFRTPLGIAEIDRKIASALLAADDDCVSDQEVHAAEHSIEVEVPFVQVLFPRARIVPVVVASSERAISARLGEALAAVVKDRKALIVASSDLSHYPSAADAEVVDREVLDAMASLDPARLRSTIEAAMGRHVPDLVTCACGEAPVLAAMEAARRLGAKGGSVISYANSGQTAFGGASHVVGYGAVAFGADAAPMKTKGEMKEPPYSDTFSQAERDALLAFARESISRAVTTQTAPLARGFDDNLRQRRGVFVTLKKGGELRGCIGHTEPDVPLCRLVGAMAISAALQDPRFPPVAPGEVPGLEIEISVLTRLTEGRRADDIVIGKDGVVLSKGGKSALFLPQVAVEQHWDRPTMLDNLCQKAGMDRLCWREGARFATFQAIVFGEDAHRGR